MNTRIDEGYARIKDATGRLFAIVFVCSACERLLIWSFENWKCPCGNDSFRIETAVEILEPPTHRRSKKPKIEDVLRDSDINAQLAERQDIIYGHHDSLPQAGEHVSRLKKSD